MPRRWVLSAIKAPRYVPTMFGGGRLQHDQRPPGNVAADFEATNVPPETGQRAGAGYSFPGRREPGSQRFPAHPRLWPLAETLSVFVVGRGRTVTHKVRHFGRVCEWDQSRTPVEIPPRMLSGLAIIFNTAGNGGTTSGRAIQMGTCILFQHESGRHRHALPWDSET